ncbi:hypothetical protein Scep_007090 [Stephania cephalantha]|uniref:Uncharacterized protein n=1 Tax=Stephania cephalantha TaxID=152367 RepID=A0AAP0K936_9MAGN
MACNNEEVEERIHEPETGSNESVMSYRNRYDHLRQFARDLVREDSDDVYHFEDGLRLDIIFYVVSSGARTLGEIYERALSHETLFGQSCRWDAVSTSIDT